MDFESKWKVCLMKLPLFLLKNELWPRYKAFYVFCHTPSGHFRHASPAPILIHFFCFSLITNRKFIWSLGNHLKKNCFLSISTTTKLSPIGWITLSLSGNLGFQTALNDKINLTRAERFLYFFAGPEQKTLVYNGVQGHFCILFLW